MRTLEFLPEKKRRRIASNPPRSCPLAHRLGLAKIKELEDLALKFLEPEIYSDLVKRVNATRRERELIISHVTKPVREALVEARIHARFEGRPKHFYSIYNKIVKRGIVFEEIYDLHAIRIIVERWRVLHTLGIVHSLYTPIHERFKDYIAMPKSNGYQSFIPPSSARMAKKSRFRSHRVDAPHRRRRHRRPLAYKEGACRRMSSTSTWDGCVRCSRRWTRRGRNQLFMEHLKVNLFQVSLCLHPARDFTACRFIPRRSTLPCSSYRHRAALPRRQGQRPHRPPEPSAGQR